MGLAIGASSAAKETVTSLSTLDLLSGASLVVQLVLLILLVFSVLSWAIILFKWGLINRCHSSTEVFLEVFWSGKSMDQIYAEAKKLSKSAVAKVFQAGYVELQRLIERERQRGSLPSDGKLVPPESTIGNLERALNKASRSESMKLERSLSFLATAGSTAPFIGLFGTVWGIMNSFKSIGSQGGASLAVVAPGIAEALIATAVGLACAIPAVMGYNYYVHKIRSLRTQMENFSCDFLNIVRRNFLAG